MPGVLAASGMFLDQSGALHGSDYASGYKSSSPFKDVETA
jgi:hypothetical protein